MNKHPMTIEFVVLSEKEDTEEITKEEIAARLREVATVIEHSDMDEQPPTPHLLH